MRRSKNLLLHIAARSPLLERHNTPNSAKHNNDPDIWYVSDLAAFGIFPPSKIVYNWMGWGYVGTSLLSLPNRPSNIVHESTQSSTKIQTYSSHEARESRLIVRTHDKMPSQFRVVRKVPASYR